LQEGKSCIYYYYMGTLELQAVQDWYV